MRRAQGDGNCGSSFSTSCQDWRDVGHRCRASTTGSVGQVLHRKALHSSPPLLLFSPRGHNDRNHRGFGHPVWPPDLRPLALAVPPPARRGLPRRLCLTCAANHGPRGRARHPSSGRVPRTGARRLRERGLPAVPHPLLAGRERWDAARVGVGWSGALPAARGRGRAGPGPAGPLDPLPPWPAWYVQWLPDWMHRGMTLTIIAIELLVPWLIAVPDRWERWGRHARYTACGLLVFGQLAIALTGNYGFFNLLAIVLCLSLLDDEALGRVLPLRLAAGDPEPRWK